MVPAFVHLERPQTVGVIRIILALDGALRRQGARLPRRKAHPPSGVLPRRSLQEDVTATAARPYVAQQIAPAGYAGRIGHEQRLIIRNGGGRNVGVRRHGDDHAAGDDCLFLSLTEEEFNAAVLCVAVLLCVKNTGLHPAAQGFDKLTIGGKLRRKDQLAVLVSGEYRCRRRRYRNTGEASAFS